MREVQINKNLKLREDGKLFNIRTGEEFIPSTDTNGRYHVCYGGRKSYPVHKLVMEFFGPPKPGPEYQIDHKNQNPLDNDINNLRWVTASENCYNKSNNLPVGQRLCDFDDPKEYFRIHKRNYRKKNKEHVDQYNKEYYKKKKEGH